MSVMVRRGEVLVDGCRMAVRSLLGVLRTGIRAASGGSAFVMIVLRRLGDWRPIWWVIVLDPRMVVRVGNILSRWRMLMKLMIRSEMKIVIEIWRSRSYRCFCAPILHYFLMQMPNSLRFEWVLSGSEWHLAIAQNLMYAD